MATHSVTLGRYLVDFDAPCETGRLRARKRLTLWLEICHRVVAQFPQYSRMSPSDVRVLVVVGTRGVRALRLLHKAAQSGKQRRT